MFLIIITDISSQIKSKSSQTQITLAKTGHNSFENSI